MLKEKKLEMLVDPDLQTNYKERELEQVIHGVALHARISNGTTKDVRRL